MKALVRLACVSSLLAVTACVGAEKSSNPLSPYVAGPIPGIAISAPSPLNPAAGAKVPVDQQPITLVIGNSSTNGPRPLNYLFEIATDAGFANKVFTRDGITPGDGATSLKLPDLLATGRTYYWRSRAQDGANTGPYSSSVSFNVFTPIVIGKPQLLSPANNEKVTSAQPTFTFANVTRSGPVGPISYKIQVSTNSAFAPVYADWNAPEQPGQTGTQLPTPGNYGQYLFWRVYAYDNVSTTVGPWSDTRAFLLPDAPPPPPGGGDWQSCGAIPGEEVVKCVHAAINPAHTAAGAFEVTKRVAWLLRGGGAGLLIKNGGENIVSWRGYSFSAARMVYPDLHLYKLLSDVPTTNGPTWQDEGIDPSLAGRYVPAIDPSLP